MHTYLEIIFRSAIAFVLILVITRILGKHTISQMTYHDFVSSITLGAITGNIAFHTGVKSWHMVAALITFSGIAYVLAQLSLKNRKLRKWFSGKPTVLIENSVILEENLRALKFSLDTLNQELREKDIFDIGEVEYAVLELNGRVSVLKKPEYRQITRKDLSLASPANIRFPIELIMDGQVISENITQDDMSPEWLSKQLEIRNLSLDEVFYAVKGTNGNLYFDLYKDPIKHPIDIE